jgi:hypothetical protein
MVTGVGAVGRHTSLRGVGDVATRRKITCEASDAADTHVTLSYITQQSDIPHHFFFSLPLVSQSSCQRYTARHTDSSLILIWILVTLRRYMATARTEQSLERETLKLCLFYGKMGILQAEAQQYASARAP